MHATVTQGAHLPLPLTIEEITADWLTAALRTRAPGATVERFEFVDFIRGTCTKIRLRLFVDAAGREAGIPETVILKGGFEPHSRAMCTTHEKEACAYGEILPELGLRTPACYFAAYDEPRQQGIVIIEDLVARGVSFCNPLRPQTHAEVASRLAALAAFHARSWDSPRFASGGDWSHIEALLPATVVYMSQFLDTPRWDHFIAEPRGAAASVRFHDRARVAAGLAQLPELTAQLPPCVLHGDTHLGNLYVDPDGTPGFFDPQVLKGPSLAEVAYHVAGALDTGDRRRSEGALVGHYLDQLALHGVTPPAFDAAMRMYSGCLLYGYCIFLVNESFFQSEAINTAYTARFSAAMLDNGTLDILQA